MQPVDVEGSQRLVEAARRARVDHLVYISIVGIDRIPSYGYYRAKLAAEGVMMSSGIPWTILRATQFYELVDRILMSFLRYPVGFLPGDLQAQPVGSGEVAEALRTCVVNGPAGRLPDMGGPEMQSLDALARAWMQARRQKRWMIPLYLPGQTWNAFRRGYTTCPQNRQGKISWLEWLSRHHPTS